MAILNFCVKRKNLFILITVLDRAILSKLLTHRVSSEFTDDFSQKHFPGIFGSHLKFLYKMQKRICLGNGERLADFDKIFYLHGIVFPPFLSAIINF